MHIYEHTVHLYTMLESSIFAFKSFLHDMNGHFIRIMFEACGARGRFLQICSEKSMLIVYHIQHGFTMYDLFMSFYAYEYIVRFSC